MGCLQSKATDIDPGTPGKKNINEVAGNIYDGDSKKPMSEVTVTAYSANKKEKFVITDEWGRFEFDELKFHRNLIKENVEFQVSFIKYKLYLNK